MTISLKFIFFSLWLLTLSGPSDFTFLWWLFCFNVTSLSRSNDPTILNFFNDFSLECDFFMSFLVIFSLNFDLWPYHVLMNLQFPNDFFTSMWPVYILTNFSLQFMYQHHLTMPRWPFHDLVSYFLLHCDLWPYLFLMNLQFSNDFFASLWLHHVLVNFLRDFCLIN